MNWHLKWILKLLSLLAVTSLRLTAASKYNVSLAEMATCKEYDLRGTGYVYSDFFQVRNMENNNLAPDERLHLKFYVMTSMDAHILLSVNDQPRQMDRVYEVVIGAGGNTFSAIRTAMGRRRVATNQDPRILSIFDPTPIEIVQKKDGNLLVYIPGLKDGPILNFTDASPLNINYISFSAFGSISARWFYDCQFDGFGSEIEQEVRPLSAEQRLTNNITANAGNKTVPMGLKEVSFNFNIEMVSHRQEAAILSTRMHLMLYWSDERLVWQPEDFAGIRHITHPALDIWTPQIMVLNGAHNSFRHFAPHWDIRLDSFGNVVMLARNAWIDSWCPNSAQNWPNDKLRCELILGLQDFDAEHKGPLELFYVKPDELLTESVATFMEWQLVQLNVSRIVSGNGTRFNEHTKVQTVTGDMWIGFSLKRNSGFYSNVFIMPLLACETLIILSFLLHGYRRGALLLVVLLIASLGLMFITKRAPHYYIPTIMITYQHIMHLTVSCYWLHISILWLQRHPPRQKPYAWLMTLVNCSPLRFVLCMRMTDISEFVSIQEHPWHEVAKMLNNLSFILVNILLIIYDVFLISNKQL